MAKSNLEIANALRELALFLEMREVPFKPRAYEKAAMAVEALARPVAALYRTGGAKALDQIPGVGKSIAGKLAQLLETGAIAQLEELRRETPVDVLGLTAVEGIGARTVRALYERLHVANLDDLERAARAGSIRHVPHFGEKAEERILHGIDQLRATAGRQPLGAVWPMADELEARLRGWPGVERAAAAGSLRRRRDTIGDLDFVVAARVTAPVTEAFTSMPEVVRVHARGPTKALVRLSAGLDADLRVVPPESYGAALLYFTGSKDHGVALRRIAREQGLKLNEYGLFRGSRAIAGRTEAEVYDALGLAYVPPELREDQGEIEAARAGTLPELVDHDDLRGDLQAHTDWSDGADSIEDMARAARRLGREYLAITDHTRDLAMAHGADEPRLREQIAAVRRVARTVHGIRLLAGAEVNIRRDGSLDVADETLAALDVVGAAVHSHFDLPRDEMTRRVIRAIENPHVDVLFHPTARQVGRRAAIELDLDAVLAAARRTGTALEIDAQPRRLDLDGESVRRAVQAGVKLVIDSDAHRTADLGLIGSYGIALARRGWATRADVLNTLPVEGFLAALRGAPRPGRRSKRAS